MFKSIVKYFAKKYVISLLNDALEAAKSKVDIDKWRNKVQQVLDVCQKIMNALEDNKIEDSEAKEVIESASKLF